MMLLSCFHHHYSFNLDVAQVSPVALFLVHPHPCSKKHNQSWNVFSRIVFSLPKSHIKIRNSFDDESTRLVFHTFLWNKHFVCKISFCISFWVHIECKWSPQAYHLEKPNFLDIFCNPVPSTEFRTQHTFMHRCLTYIGQ